MNKYLSQPVVAINSRSYLTFIIILMPLLNFLGGINIDLYAPSMPAIATAFSVSMVTVKNTIAMTILGWTLGALVFGALIDSIGRKKTMCFGLLLYVMASAFCPWCHTIEQLMFLRFIQGFATLSISIGCRALIVDNITGHRYQIAIVYTSVGYGLGPVIGPFIGGILQHFIGWQANFIALFIISLVLLIILVLFIKESLPQKQPIILANLVARYLAVLRHKKFICGVFILGLTQIQMLLYPTLGPFIIEHVLHNSALVYGNTALLVGGGYLTGGLLNRLLLHQYSVKHTSYLAYLILLLAVVLSYLFSHYLVLSITTVLVPIILVNISSGFMFSNIMGNNLKQFPSHVGTTMAIQMALLAIITATGIFVASHIHIAGLMPLSVIYSLIAALSVLLFFTGYKALLQ